jgi:hypothetical protein
VILILLHIEYRVPLILEIVHLVIFASIYTVVFYLILFGIFLSTNASSTVFPPVFVLLLDNKLMIHILAT